MRTKSRTISFEERAALLSDWEHSGLTQREYSRRQGIPVRTLEYYRRQQLRRQAASESESESEPRRAKPEPERLVAVQVAPREVTAAAAEATAGRRFAVTLSNGRRLEADWGCCEAHLARLVRLLEQV